MKNLIKQKALIEFQIKELERLRTERDTYKHAFETTAIDRDRLQYLLDKSLSSDGNSKISISHDVKTAPMHGSNISNYGPLWGNVANDYEGIVKKGPIEPLEFEAILRYGGFSQFSMYTDDHFLSQFVDWQIAALAEIGLVLKDLSRTLCESEAMPMYLCFEREGRQISIDFLRLLTYTDTISTHLSNAGVSSPQLIVEIGSGYGGLARLLKLHYPDTTICLIDIPVCLRAAEYYLRKSMQGAQIVHLRDVASNDISESKADFILIPVEEAYLINGQNIDLAVNIWSFGEMPNHYIQTWFDFIQKHNTTDHLFLLNHFMASIELEPGNVEHQANHYNWLRGIDKAWKIQAFEIDPLIERPPSVLHKHRGLMLFATRLMSDEEVTQEKQAAVKTAKVIHGYDWVRGSLKSNAPSEKDPSSARRTFLTYPIEPITPTTEFILDQFDRILSMWRPDIDSTQDSTFFHLWNDYRMNGDHVSLRLLRIWMHLQWRPMLRTQEGETVDTIFREELQFGLTPEGSWCDDPYLQIPNWMDRRLVPLKN